MKLIIKFGLVTFMVLVAYFTICHFIGITNFLELRFVNGVVLLIFILLALKERYRQATKPTYYQGLGIALGVSVIATLLFAALVFIFLSANQSFMNQLMIRAPFGKHLTPLLSAIAIFTEGFGSSILISLAAMQYFNKHDRKN